MRPRGAAGGCRDGATYFFVSKYGGVAAGVSHSVGFFSGLRTYSPLANGRGKYLLTKESERALRKTYLAHLHELENEATGLHGAKCTNDGSVHTYRLVIAIRKKEAESASPTSSNSRQQFQQGSCLCRDIYGSANNKFAQCDSQPFARGRRFLNSQPRTRVFVLEIVFRYLHFNRLRLAY